MKQSAVEYAVEKLEKFIPSGNQIVIAIILEESKRMEKQQKGYSEEDMEEMYNYGYNNYLPYSEAIEQFKNK